MPEADILASVEKTYAAALDPGKWGAALTSISDLLGGFDATLEVHTSEHQLPLTFLPGERIPTSGTTDYLAYYSTVCPRLNSYKRSHVAGHIGFDYDIMTEAELDKDEFYSDFLAPEDLRYFISATLATKADFYTGLYVHRTPAQGHVEDQEIRLMQRIMPHVASAFEVHQRLQQKNMRDIAMETALDMAGFGAFLLDRAGRLIFANRFARKILNEGDAILLNDKKLTFSDHSASRNFDQILGQMFDGSLEAPWSWGGDIHVKNGAQKLGYTIAVRRLPETQDFAVERNEAAIVFVTEHQCQMIPEEDTLITGLGLTKAEADVAIAFVKLGSIAKVAQFRRVSRNTIRSQLYDIMDKLDVHSQADLMRALLSLRTPFNQPDVS